MGIVRVTVHTLLLHLLQRLHQFQIRCGELQIGFNRLTLRCGDRKGKDRAFAKSSLGSL